MGCASSKQKRCRHCQNATYSPIPRSYSMHVHHPPQTKNDTYHVVALTSSTLGSLLLDSSQDDGGRGVVGGGGDNSDKNRKKEEFSVGLVEAKTWSNMINDKIPKMVPKTPTRTPPGEPETINAWELMEGLEDTSPFRSPIHVRSFSFDVVVPDPNPPDETHFDRPKSRFQEKPMWLQMADIDAAAQEFDHDGDEDGDSVLAKQSFQFDGKNRERLVVYFTSLRGVRKTYEDCCLVRVILKGLGVRVDERDVSMHSGFKEELRELLKDGFHGNGGLLPRVFVGKRYIGGAEEIRRLHEDGQLEKLLECCEKIDDGCGGGDNGGVCEACGDIRFVPCETCCGSCKIYYEEEDVDDDVDNGMEENEYGFQRCPDCNENGLIRCPICCY